MFKNYLFKKNGEEIDGKKNSGKTSTKIVHSCVWYTILKHSWICLKNLASCIKNININDVLKTLLAVQS